MQLTLKADNTLFRTLWGAPVLNAIVLTRRNLTDLEGCGGFQGLGQVLPHEVNRCSTVPLAFRILFLTWASKDCGTST